MHHCWKSHVTAQMETACTKQYIPRSDCFFWLHSAAKFTTIFWWTPCSLKDIQCFSLIAKNFQMGNTGPPSAAGNVSGYRCVSDCNSRGREFDPGPVPYFRGDWSWNNFYGHSPPFRWFIQEGLLSVTSESMFTNYWLSACSSLPRKKCG